jgi:hypothetical protein
MFSVPETVTVETIFPAGPPEPGPFASLVPPVPAAPPTISSVAVVMPAGTTQLCVDAECANVFSQMSPEVLVKPAGQEVAAIAGVERPPVVPAHESANARAATTKRLINELFLCFTAPSLKS